MELSAYLAFIIVSAAQVATPGPSTLFIVNNALAFGPRRAIGVLSGDLIAIALLASLSVAGLGALLVAYPVAFLILRLAGAGYVIWLGWGYLRTPPAQPQTATSADQGHDGGSLWLHSFGVGISNPKAVLFFAALFPQFIPVGSGASVLALLVLTFVVVKLVVLGGYALGARRIGQMLRKPEHARHGRLLTGGIFVLFGALMIWSALSEHLGQP
ncbi:LysE family translocator [Paracoccus caeni]|uniref:LysE family translocator n=1 Tax=Paracoccus caeni TaxID=657651 RepID=A0A934SDD6_9RHOB|nr:LysE family translocator [Paracoccus caeni]MBK4216815.1 LysE family translocator [Paracoccus caeni]